VLVKKHIGIHENKNATNCLMSSSIARYGGSAMRLLEKPDIEFLYDLRRLIRRAVIKDNDLILVYRLMGQRLQTFSNVVFFVVARDDDGEVF
jgi:hypothetical protein